MIPLDPEVVTPPILHPRKHTQGGPVTCPMWVIFLGQNWCPRLSLYNCKPARFLHMALSQNAISTGRQAGFTSLQRTGCGQHSTPQKVPSTVWNKGTGPGFRRLMCPVACWLWASASPSESQVLIFKMENNAPHRIH